MDDTRIPWWLVLLLGIGIAGLAVWQSSRWKQQIRAGAGALALVYLALLAFAIGRDPRGTGIARPWSLSEVSFAALCVTSITTAVLLSARPSYRGQLTWFGLMSLSNAGLCFAMKDAGTALVLTLMGILSIILLLTECRKEAAFRVQELWPDVSETKTGESLSVTWLAGGTGLAIAIALVGTTHYALSVESTRAVQTRRHSALPSRTRIRTVLQIHPDQERSASRIDLAFGPRADIIVLLAVLAFVALASMSTKQVSSEVVLVPVSDADASREPDPLER